MFVYQHHLVQHKSAQISFIVVYAKLFSKSVHNQDTQFYLMCIGCCSK